MYYKKIVGGFIDSVYNTKLPAVGEGMTEITAEEYETILEAVKHKPEDTDSVCYRLTEELVYVETEPEEPEEEDPFENPDYMAGYEQALLDLMELELEEEE